MPPALFRSAAVCAATLLSPFALAQQTHTLLATPTTVAWGYYWSQAKPVLNIQSGDTVVIQTLSTCGPPARLETRGIAAADIPDYVRAIYDKVPTADRGPGGHILTGPIAIAEADPATSSKSASRISTSTSPGPATEPAKTVSSPKTSPTASPRPSPSTSKR
jgi:hypothetical protein